MDPPGLLAVAFPTAGHEARMTFRLEEKTGDRSGLYFTFEDLPADDPPAALRARGRWTALLVGLKNFLEAGEVGLTEPTASHLDRA